MPATIAKLETCGGFSAKESPSLLTQPCFSKLIKNILNLGGSANEVALVGNSALDAWNNLSQLTLLLFVHIVSRFGTTNNSWVGPSKITYKWYMHIYCNFGILY